MVYPWAVSDSELEGLHKHCYKCFSVPGCRGGSDSCDIVRCKLGCKHSFHLCKEAEHQQLCEKECIPCPNNNYGCGLQMERNQIARHLPVCPANIIACTQEWNRWPLFCSERFKSIPFRRRNPSAKRGDLDLELTLRDQRIAAEFSQVPRKTKLALRNNLTRRYPALPLPHHSTRKPTQQDRTVRTLADILKFEVSDDSNVGPQYGVAKLFLKQQETQQRRWQEDVDKAIQRTGQPIPKKYWEFDELEKGNIHEHCAHCILAHCDKKFEYDMTSCSMVQCPYECGFTMHHCKALEHRMICKNFEEEGEFDWILRDRRVRKKKNLKEKPVQHFPDLLKGPTVNPYVRCEKGRIPPPPPLPGDYNSVVRFDIQLETVTKLQQKPRAMYTFLCGQDLRRDQWEGHNKNVHSDIHGGLNNWLVARCPLASLGCGFSFNRLYPGSNAGNRVVFSPLADSFGIQPAPLPIHTNSDPSSTSLHHLPVEILQLILLKLDSWSLNQISLVSRYLREVTCTLLDTRGCVALQWERTGDGIYQKRGWEVAYKRWFFSCHFSPVHSWGINADAAVSQHLKDCPYNDRCVHYTPDRTSETSKIFLKALNSKIKLKRESEWFIQ